MTAYATNPAHAAPIARPWGLLQLLRAALRARRQRKDIARSYAMLLGADDYRLSDLGVTRHDVLRMIADIDAR
jgi:uncharacterized protein YjiS (DUF1127 family)